MIKTLLPFTNNGITFLRKHTEKPLERSWKIKLKTKVKTMSIKLECHEFTHYIADPIGSLNIFHFSLSNKYISLTQKAGITNMRLQFLKSETQTF